MQFAAKRPFVERLDVLQDVPESPPARRDPVVRKCVEHERIVGVGAVPEQQVLDGRRPL